MLDIGWANEVFSVGLSWLVQGELLWKFLSSEHHGKWISARVGVVDLFDLDGIISQVVVHNVGHVTEYEEFEHFAVVLKELLLAGDPSST
jgi:hypothetical protein